MKGLSLFQGFFLTIFAAVLTGCASDGGYYESFEPHDVQARNNAPPEASAGSGMFYDKRTPKRKTQHEDFFNKHCMIDTVGDFPSRQNWSCND